MSVSMAHHWNTPFVRMCSGQVKSLCDLQGKADVLAVFNIDGEVREKHHLECLVWCGSFYHSRCINAEGKGPGSQKASSFQKDEREARHISDITLACTFLSIAGTQKYQQEGSAAAL
uniref:Uncharacterized protein n=1 Tax=Rhipicephalus zambeziensis TaxID=60191 RepID=A0A224Y6R3_9ACAR